MWLYSFESNSDFFALTINGVVFVACPLLGSSRSSLRATLGMGFLISGIGIGWAGNRLLFTTGLKPTLMGGILKMMFYLVSKSIEFVGIMLIKRST